MVAGFFLFNENEFMKAGGGINWLCLFDENEFMRPWLFYHRMNCVNEAIVFLFLSIDKCVFDLIFERCVIYVWS
jgi:hypothetical protein